MSDSIQVYVEVVGNAVSLMQGVKCVHELTMEGPKDPSMGMPIYYVDLACSLCSWCSLTEHPELKEHFCSWCSLSLAGEPREHSCT